MTLLEEELKTLETSPDYRRVLKVYIKHQIYTLFQKLSEFGEDSFALTANVSDGTFSHVGSSKGEVFLDKIHDLHWKFLSFCSSTDNHPDSFEVLPVPCQDTVINLETEDEVYTGEEVTAITHSHSGYRKTKDNAGIRTKNIRGYKKQDKNGVFRAEKVGRYTEDELNESPVFRTEGVSVYKQQDEAPVYRSDRVSAYKEEIEEQGDSYEQDGAGGDNCTFREEEEIEYEEQGDDTGKLDSASLFGNRSAKDDLPIGKHGMSSTNGPLDLVLNSEDRAYDSQTVDVNIPIKEEVEEDCTSSKNYPHSDLQRQTKWMESMNMNSYILNQLGIQNMDAVSQGYQGDVSQRTQRCDVCGLIFDTLGGLHRHHSAVHTTKVYFCQICGKDFKNSMEKTSHEQSHLPGTMSEESSYHMEKQGRKMYACQLCGKYFPKSSSLKNHIATHLNLKQHQCGFCGKKFNHKNKFNAHMKVCTRRISE